jgi:NAD(P)-dependent dehydrogenase (short-subunit alcohol dehydrogenase family)
MKSLADKVAVVTGAASGIGRATSLLLSRKCLGVALVDIDSHGLIETARLIGSGQCRISTHRVNVAERDCMEALPELVFKEHGRIHILINNAGVYLEGLLDQQSIQDIEWIIGVNLWGVIYGCKFFLPFLKRVPEAHIVNVGSMLGFMGVRSRTSYCATKSALRGFTEALRAELRGTHIGVTGAYPGPVRTNIARTAKSYNTGTMEREIQYLESRGITPDAAAEKIVRGIAANRPRVTIGATAFVVDRLTRVSPVLTGELWARISGKFNGIY